MNASSPKGTLTARSVDNLQTLYTVVVALALAQAIKSLLNVAGEEGRLTINVEQIPTFAALLFTLIPFHHGASRYLDEAYIPTRPQGRPLTGLVHFFLFFIEALALYVMALLTPRPKLFFFALAGLLGIDLVWLVFVYFSARPSFQKVRCWFWLNLPTVIIVLILNAGRFMADGACKWLVLAALVLVRTGLDYELGRRFYWPDENADVAGTPRG